VTPRQKRFVAALAAGATQKDAAIAAGYSEKSADSQASQLLKNPKVSASLDAINAKADAAVDLSVEQFRKDLYDTHKEARKAEQYGPAVSALGKLLDKALPDLADPNAALEIRVKRA
jgi:phage terminase small subunit